MKNSILLSIYFLFGIFDICVLFGLGYFMVSIRHSESIPMLLVYLLGCIVIQGCVSSLLIYSFKKIVRYEKVN